MGQSEQRELELLAMRNTLSTEGGRAFMWRCLLNCGTFETMFTIDPFQHAFGAGMRSHGVWLDAELREASPNDYYKMMRENNDG